MPVSASSDPFERLKLHADEKLIYIDACFVEEVIIAEGG